MALFWIAGIALVAVGYFNADNGGIRFGAPIIVGLVCFGVALASTPKRNSYGVDCRHYSIFASDC